MENRVLFSAMFVIACFVADAYAALSSDCEVTAGWTSLQLDDSASGHDKPVVKGEIDLDPDSIQLGKPFSFNARFCPKHSIKPDRVVADATMPAHKHGMNYTPTVTLDETSGLYHVENFVFHMPGEWEITVSAYAGEEATHYVHTLTVD